MDEKSLSNNALWLSVSRLYNLVQSEANSK